MKIYQVHHRMDHPVTGVMHSITYQLSTDAKTIIASIPVFQNTDEIYALEVTSQTLRDEISHCKNLLEDWKTVEVGTTMSAEAVSATISRQENLIKHYEELIAQQSVLDN